MIFLCWYWVILIYFVSCLEPIRILIPRFKSELEIVLFYFNKWLLTFISFLLINDRLKEHVNEVSNIMQENIDKILERGSRLDHLEDRSEMLSSRADEFRVSARRVSRRMWWQNMKINIIIAVIVIVVILIIVCKYFFIKVCALIDFNWFSLLF